LHPRARAMKFCMVSTFYPPFNFGGDGIYVQALARELIARGHDVTVVHCMDAYRLLARQTVAADDEQWIDGVRVVRLQSRWGALSPLLTQQTGLPLLKRERLQRLFAEGFDVVNFHNISLVGGPAVLRIPAGAAVKLYTLHEHWLLCPTHVFWKNRARACDTPTCLSCCLRSGVPPQAWRASHLIEDALRHVQALLAPSEFTARLHRQAGFKPPVLINPLFSRLQAPPASSAAAEPYFLCVGRVTASKGVPALVEQFAAQPRHVLWVAGAGDALPALQQRFGDHPRIRFLGAVDAEQLPALYSGARALIMPSLAPETFGLSAVEAMACGTPAIVRDAGGCREIVEASGAGHVYTEFAELPPLLDRLADDSTYRTELAQRARTASRERFSVERHVERYLSVVQSLRAGRALELEPA
jgi:glycosyltransferase involved in cell wall biosynthesis